MDTPARRGDWMQTFTGQKFWPLDPKIDEIHIEDIAHSLSMQCRYAGHCIRFYSVAEHSVLMAEALPAKHRKWALLHDAAEAYLVDVPRPVKKHIVGYDMLEERLTWCIGKRFDMQFNNEYFCDYIPQAVKDADNRILLDERHQNMLYTLDEWALDVTEPLGVTLRFWPPAMAKARFLEAWHDACAMTEVA